MEERRVRLGIKVRRNRITSAQIRAARCEAFDEEVCEAAADGLDVTRLPSIEEAARYMELRPWYESEMRSGPGKNENPNKSIFVDPSFFKSAELDNAPR